MRSRSLNQGAWADLIGRFEFANRAWRFMSILERFDSEAEPRLLTEGNGYRILTDFLRLCSQKTRRAAFFPQETAVHVHHCDLRADIEEIEALSGLSFSRRQLWMWNCSVSDARLRRARRRYCSLQQEISSLKSSRTSRRRGRIVPLRPSSRERARVRKVVDQPPATAGSIPARIKL